MQDEKNFSQQDLETAAKLKELHDHYYSDEINNQFTSYGQYKIHGRNFVQSIAGLYNNIEDKDVLRLFFDQAYLQHVEQIIDPNQWLLWHYQSGENFYKAMITVYSTDNFMMPMNSFVLHQLTDELNSLMKRQRQYLVHKVCYHLNWFDKLIFKKVFTIAEVKWKKKIFLWYFKNKVRFIPFDLSFTMKGPGFLYDKVEIYGWRYTLNVPGFLRFIPTIQGLFR